MVHDEVALQQQRTADEALDHESPIEELFEDQLKCADLVVLSKADLVSAEGLAKARQIVAGETRDNVRFLEASNGAVSVSAILGLTAEAEDDMEVRKSHHDDHDHDHDHDDFETFIVAESSHASVEDARAAVLAAMASHGVLRIKGAVSIAGKAVPLAVQAVGPRVETWFAPASGGSPKLVVIGEKGLDCSAITAMLAQAPAIKQAS